MLIQVGDSMTSRHGEVITKPLEFACRNSSTKAELVDQRAKLLKRYS